MKSNADTLTLSNWNVKGILFFNILSIVMKYRVVFKNMGFVVPQTWDQIQTAIYDSSDLG